MTTRTPSPASPWRGWSSGCRKDYLPPSRLLLRRALNDPVLFEALLRELELREDCTKAPLPLRRALRRTYLEAAAETERLCEERLWRRMTPEGEARQLRYVEARRAQLSRRDALLYAVGRRPGPLPTSAGRTPSPAPARPVEASMDSEMGAA